jgi:hypothetical protein
MELHLYLKKMQNQFLEMHFQSIFFDKFWEIMVYTVYFGMKQYFIYNTGHTNVYFSYTSVHVGFTLPALPNVTKVNLR